MEGRNKIHVTSSIDGSEQASYLILPPGFSANAEHAALVVSLHSWSADLEQRNIELEELVVARGWISLFPNL